MEQQRAVHTCSVIVEISSYTLLWWLSEFHTFLQLRPAHLGNDLHLVLLLGKRPRVCAHTQEQESTERLLEQTRLILTVVDGQKPKSVRVATVPGLS